MKAVVKKWGNSLGIRIAKPMAKENNLLEGSEINIYSSDGKIIIEPLPKEDYCLDNILEKITKDNIHGETSTNGPVGGEVW